MSNIANLEDMSHALVAAVRQGLDAAGHHDVRIEREWLAIGDEGGHRIFTLNVPVGRNLVLPVWSCDRGDPTPQELVDRFTQELVRALLNIAAARWQLRRYAMAARRVAEAALEEAQRQGIELSVARMSLQRTRSFHLAEPNWRDAAESIFAAVIVNSLGRHLRPELVETVVDAPEDVIRKLSELYDDQQARQAARDALRRAAADIAVDTVTLRHLDKYRVDRLGALREAAQIGHLNTPVRKADGTPGNLYLLNDAGTIKSTVLDCAGFVWALDRLQAEGTSAANIPEVADGSPVSHVCGVDVYHGLTIRRTIHHGCRAFELDQPIHLVDLDSGRIWEADNGYAWQPERPQERLVSCSLPVAGE